MSHIWMCHTQEVCCLPLLLQIELVLSHLWINHVTHMNVSHSESVLPATSFADWWCLDYFMRNSLSALLEALFTCYMCYLFTWFSCKFSTFVSISPPRVFQKVKFSFYVWGALAARELPNHNQFRARSWGSFPAARHRARTKNFLESCGCRTRPLDTSAYRNRLVV